MIRRSALILVALAAILSACSVRCGHGAPPVGPKLGASPIVFEQIQSTFTAPGTPAWNPTWYAATSGTTTFICWDPATGSDSASPGTAASCGACSIGSTSLLTPDEIVRRYGSSSPTLIYGNSVTVCQLTSQPATQGAFFFGPKLSGGGQAVLLGSRIVVQSSFTGGAVTSKVRGGPGTLLQVASMPIGTAAKMLVLDSTRNSYAFIDSMAGQVATLSQPIPSSVITTIGIPALLIDDTWATGDTLSTYTLPLVNLKMWRPTGGDMSSGAVASAGWVQWVEVADSSGTAASEYPFVVDSAVSVLSACRIDTRVHVAQLNGRGQAAYILGSDVGASLVEFSGGTMEVWGGILRAGFNMDGGATHVGGDSIWHGSSTFSSGEVLVDSSIYGDGSIALENNATIRANTSIWGSTSITINPGCVYWNSSGSTFALNLLTSGALKIGTNTTGTKYVSGVYTDGVALTAANMDLFGGLQNPLTGARFSLGQ